jgi:subtilisin family serine protease
MKIINLCLLFLTVNFSVLASGKYWVLFNDKDNVEFDPYQYFDPKTIQKRLDKGISLVHYSDLPLREDYCLGVENITEIHSRSRWLNAVSIKADNKKLREIRDLPFVRELIPVEMKSTTTGRTEGSETDPDLLFRAARQLQVMEGNYFKARGIDGSGVRIAVFDGGFTWVDTHEAFRHLREEGRIVKTWDFVKDVEFVYDYNTHGTGVLGCIAGIWEDMPLGLATGAEFLLARTEIGPEVFAEEEYWAEAMEWADKNGADIISSSLGYTFHRYFPRNMDGKTVFVTKIANIAASKGMLVINSAGNEGDSPWEVIGAPADADSVLSVGGISSRSGTRISFSSYGPTFDGRLKPNVVGFGDAVTAGKNGLKVAYGTSFSAPLVTGFAACVKQMNPEWTYRRLFTEIQKSGHLYPYYDYAHGYGVPQAGYFTGEKREEMPSFYFEEYEDILFIHLERDLKELPEDEEGTEEGEINFYPFDRYLYYHFADRESGKIRKYYVVRLDAADEWNIKLEELRSNELVRVHYNGYTESFDQQAN